ncbi:hypothetical protein MKW92_017947, partial [Papaver armeniacum]
GVGVPNFWLKAMKANKILVKEITEEDEVPLMYLKDIQWDWIDTSKGGFKLSFYFNGNPYFHNAVLTKIYHMRKAHPMFDELILENIEATKIEWKYERNLAWKRLGKKRKPRSDYWVSENWTMKMRICKSFFNFFSALVPDDNYDIEITVEELQNEIEKTVEELQNEIAQDYLVGCTIRDQIIPSAVLWFTREA